ncbi:MAG: hypothetical protein ABEJ77_07430 [Halanaeroarchaeum sp.]
MSVGRDTIREGALAAVGVAVFAVFLLAAASLSADGITTTGAYVIIAGIAAFVLTTAGIGIVFLDTD